MQGHRLTVFATTAHILHLLGTISLSANHTRVINLRSEQRHLGFPAFPPIADTRSVGGKSGTQAPQKHLEGDNRLWTGVMEPSGSMAAVLLTCPSSQTQLGWLLLTTKRTRARPQITSRLVEVSDSLTEWWTAAQMAEP